MLTLLLILFPFISLFLPSEGYLFYIRNNDRGWSVCYTNETEFGTMAFIEERAPFTATNKRQFSPVVIDGSNSAMKSYDCDLITGLVKCPKWNTYNYHLFNNFDRDQYDKFDPVSDIRWHNFPSVVTESSFKTMLLKQFSQGVLQGRFHTSVLAKDSAQFHFSQFYDFSNGYIVAVDGWIDKVESKFRYCGSTPPHEAANYCSDIFSQKQTSAYLERGGAWTILSNEFSHGFDANNRSVVNLQLKVNNNITAFTKSDDRNQFKSIKFVGVRSYLYYGTYKLHKYNYLQPKQQYSKMETTLTLNSPETVCFDIIYISKDAGFAIQVGGFKHDLGKTHATTWTTKRIVQQLEAGSHHVVIRANDANSYLGGIYFCTGKPMKMRSNDSNIRSCEILGRGNNDYLKTSTTKRNYSIHEQYPLSNDEVRELCSFVGHGDCAQVQICDYRGCFCISGYMDRTPQEGRCIKRCEPPFYGPDCAYSDRFCKDNTDNKKRHHDGECMNGCQEGYRSPGCKEKILHLTYPPKVTVLGPYATAIDFEQNDFQQNELFSHIQVDCSIFGQEGNFVGDFTSKFTQSEFPTIRLENLSPFKNYSCKITIFEKDGQYSDNESYGIGFRTNNCEPLSNENVIVTFEKSGIKLKLVGSLDNLCTVEKIEITKDKSEKRVLYSKDRRLISGTSPEEIEFDFEPGNTYIVTILGLDAKEELIIEHKEGAGISDTLVIVLVVVCVLIILAFVVIMLLWRKAKHRASSTSQRLVEGQQHETAVELDLVPAPEESSRKSKGEATQDPFSRVTKVSEFGEYVEAARKNGLFKSQHQLFPRGQTRPWTVGIDPANKKKNRYANLAAYDATRVQLEPLEGVEEQSDYINANFIDGYKRPRAYIATQGPKPQTVVDFWRMIWQEKVEAVVMVASLVENGKAKCEKYWPDLKNHAQYGPFIIHNMHEEIFADFIVRTLSVSFGNDVLKVEQYHYLTWPDHSVPMYPQSIAAFAKKLVAIKSDAPLTVHCSAGVGRTGTIILIDACLRMANAEGNIDVLGLMAKMRTQRANLVDNEQQFEFVHLVLYETLVLPQFSIPCAVFHIEYAALTAQNNLQITKQFEKLNEICEKEWNSRSDTNVAVIDADKCRYPEIVASSSHLVKIYPYGSISQMTNFNGVYVDGFQKKRQFIATQVPLPSTVEHFWRIVQQHAIQHILVLNSPGPMEGYYLPQIGEHLAFGDFKVTALKEVETKHCYVKTINIAPGTNQPFMTHVSSYNWPVGEVSGPEAKDIVDMWESAEKSNTNKIRLIVCHDGVTSSGIFLGVGFVLEKIKLEQQVDVALAMRTLRQSRPKFITHQEQFEALYRAAAEYLQAFDTYGNFQ